jgi:hypothetical protein
MNRPDQHNDSRPAADLTTLESAVSDDRGNLSSVLGTDDKASEERDRQSRELVISTLTTIAEELRRTKSPKQLSTKLSEVILVSSTGFMAILRAKKEVIQNVVGLLVEIKEIEESAIDEKRDVLYNTRIKGPLNYFIGAFKSNLCN